MKKTLFIILILVFSVSSVLWAGGASEQASTDGKKSITLLIHPTLYSATGGENGIIKRFQEESGIEVTVVTAPTQDLRDKALIEFVAKSGRFDVVVLLSGWLNDDLFQYLTPLDDYFNNSGAAYDKDDIIPSLLNLGKDSSGSLHVVPMRVGTAMLYYNKDLLSESGYDVPENWDDVLKVSEYFSSRGVKAVAQTFYPENKDFYRILFSMGGRVLNDDMTKATVNTPETISMISFIKTLFDKEYIAREALAWDRDPQISALQQGRAVMGVYYSPYWGRIVDPTGIAPQFSTESFAWAPSPTSEGVPKGRSMNDGWSVGIDKNSKNKDSAWLLVQALTNKENQLEMALHHANGPVRASTYLNQEYLTVFPLAEDWLTATAASIFIPPHPDWEQIQDAFNQEVFMVIEGVQTSEQAAIKAQTRIQEILDRR